ncbi:3283_t:CDS:1, partial [Gigaspora margarita]
LLKDTINMLADKLKLNISQVLDFIVAFKYNHILKQIPLGLITSSILVPFIRSSNKIKFIPL